ncbi:MAG TPA: hypothetical protein VFC61_09250 [Blastocatellia bacterium]|nr:hypothetical protein [Blastocatellia bacterium]
MRKSFSVAALFLAALGFSSCVAVGYTSDRGWFVWPGGLILLAVIVLVLMLLRRRR